MHRDQRRVEFYCRKYTAVYYIPLCSYGKEISGTIVFITVLQQYLGVACWSLVPKFAGPNPAEAVRFLRAKKSSAFLPSERK